MTRKAEILSIEEAFDALTQFAVIFLGEVHDSAFAHEAELALLTGLWQRDPNLALALEMFERDVQDVLNAYLSGTISEENFLEQSRPWPNYHDDYRPLVEFAKTKGIPVIAANVPQRAAALVAATNRLSPKIAGKDGLFFPKKVYLDSREYRQRFVASMKEMPFDSPMKGRNVSGLFKAQVLKDAVMAASLESFLDRHILFICGHFHSDSHLGIPYQLRKNHPELRIAVITFSSTVEHLPMKDRSKVADFIWLES